MWINAVCMNTIWIYIDTQCNEESYMQRYINSIYKHADIPTTLTFKFKNDDSRKPAKNNTAL